MSRKPKIMISFQGGGENGGPYVSHQRICESLQDSYDFAPLMIPQGRIGLFNPMLQRNLVNQIQAYNPDIIHIHGLQLAGYQLVCAAKKAKKPVVLAVHGSSSESICISNWKKRILVFCERNTLRRADVTYCVSDYVRNWPLVKKYAKNLFGTIYNLPHKTKSSECTGAIRKELGIAADDVVIVSTGRITREKGFDVLCDVILQWRPQQTIKFIIAGEGEYLSIFRQRIDENSLQNQVFLLGYRSDISSILKESNIFVICTLHETLCNSILEAFQESIPVVATNVGGVPEIVTDWVNGFLVEAGNANMVAARLKQLSEDHTLCLKMGETARMKMDEVFSPDIILHKIQKVYEEILFHD